MKSKYIKKYKARVKDPYYYFSAETTLDAWTGGGYYKHLWAIELFGFKIEFWKANK